MQELDAASTAATASSSIPNDVLTLPPSAFVANHHRANNPHDAKLRANPSLKSRRTSLIGSVLKARPYRRPSAKAASLSSWPQGISSDNVIPAAASDDRPDSRPVSRSASQSHVDVTAHSTSMQASNSEELVSKDHVGSTGSDSLSGRPIMDMQPLVSDLTPAKDDQGLIGAHHQHTVSQTRPQIGPRVRSLRTNETYSTQADNHHQVTIIATPPTPRLSDLPEPSSSANVSVRNAVTPALSVSPTSTRQSVDLSAGETDSPCHNPSFPILPTRSSSSNSLDHIHSTNDNVLSTSPSMLSSSPKRFSSLGRSPTITRETARAALTSTSAQDLTAGLELPEMNKSAATVRKERRRMSMLDFLSTDADRLSRSDGTSSPQLSQHPLLAQRRRTDGPSSVPLSMPLLQATSRLATSPVSSREVQVNNFMVDFSEHVELKVEPLTDHLTMFGSTQTSSNYSLAGTVVVEIPRYDRRRYVIPSMPDLSPHGAIPAEARRPSINVQALSVRYIGYSVYVDTTGRFNAIKLADVSQDLLQGDGCVCYTDVDDEIQAQGPNTSRPTNVMERPLRYEIEFDLSIPGWLPPSQHSRFGGTFYCIQAEATMDGQRIVSHITDHLGYTNDGVQLLDLNALSPEVRDMYEDGSEHSQQASKLRSKGKESWLGKTAKQLQLRSMRKAFPLDASQFTHGTGHLRASSGPSTQSIGSTSQLYSKVSEASNDLLASGLRCIKSDSTSILIHRCRDVVPVPVARLAMHGSAFNPPIQADEMPQNLIAAFSDTLNMSAPSARAISASISAPDALTDAGAAFVPRSPNRLSSLPQSISVPPLSEADLSAMSVAGIDTASPLSEHDVPFESQNDDRAAALSIPGAAVPKLPAKMPAAKPLLTASATMPNLTPSFSRSSSLANSRFGNTQSPPRTSSRAPSASRPTAPMRHFLHRPVLQLPEHLGIIGDNVSPGALSFSLTLSIPSHVPVTGPNSDTLSFGVQIEVGKTEGWNVVRRLGGLRIKDMELVCLQTERHSSMPSRSFSAAFPLPPPPNKVEAADLPVLSLSSGRDAASMSSRDIQLWNGYNREMVMRHIDLVNTGKAPDPVEHNVERVRTTIVGPPPAIRKAKESNVSGKGNQDTGKGKAKAKDIARKVDTSEQLSRLQNASGSGGNTPERSASGLGGLSGFRAAFAPVPQPVLGSGSSIMQPAPRSLTQSRTPSSSSLRLGPSTQSGIGSAPPSPRTYSGPMTSRQRRPIPFDTTSSSAQEALEGVQLDEPESEALRGSVHANPLISGNGEASLLPNTTGLATPMSAPDGLSRSSSSIGTGQRPQTRRRRFENAMNRLSTFASSMLEPNAEADAGPDPQTSSARSRNASGESGLRATYAFAGDDGEGVDLTKGRVRMTINLPLVSNNIDSARKAGSSQLVSDFESPYVRVRHKLKVKLGFGLNYATADTPDASWGQALVMCVPVRFTEAPPQDVQDQFDASRPVSSTDLAATAEGVVGDQQANVHSASAPLLPAYTQLFREDGSRLADEGEDLPRYTGRVSVVGEIETDPASSTAAAPMLPPDGDGHSRSSGATRLLPRTAMGSVEAPAYARVSESPSITMAPTHRSTSLRGRRLVLRTNSAKASSPRSSSHSTVQGRVPASPRIDSERTDASAEPSAFDPLPTRPGMRQRSATGSSLVSFSRIAPTEVLDEALALSSREQEEDRIETLQLNATEQTLGLDGETEGEEDDEDMGMGLGVNMHLRLPREDRTSSDSNSDDGEQSEQAGMMHFGESVHPSEAQEVGQAW